jgi:hypothetical protein
MMIPNDVWIGQIGRYAVLLADRDIMRKVWVDKDRSITSVLNFDELFEQVFDDLDSDSFALRLPELFPGDVQAETCARNFLQAIHAVDAEITKNKALDDPALLLESEIWAKLELASNKVLEVPFIVETMRQFNESFKK